MKSHTALALVEIEKFLLQTGMAASNFGREAVGDPNLVQQLRHGRELRHPTLLRVHRYLAERRRKAA